MTLTLAILVIGAFAVYVLTPEERRRLLAGATARVRRFGRWLVEGKEDRLPFLHALRVRTPWPLATFAIVTIDVVVFGIMLSRGPAGDADILLGVGASLGPRTANGEWWRLLTAMFVHRGLFALLFDVGIVVMIGALLERLLGSVAFALLFVTGGVLTDSLQLAGQPLAVQTGTWGTTCVLFGALLVWIVWSFRTQSELSIPRSLLRQIGCAALLFVLMTITANADARGADLCALVFGIGCGAIMMAGIGDATPGPRRLGAIAGATLALALVLAIPVRGITDVRPELVRVLALEGRTAAPYDKAVGQFKLGATTAEALAQIIDRQILPQVRQAGNRLAALRGVPREHQPLVADAEQYVRLRDESWELRAHALHTANMRALRIADDRERASLEVLARLRTVDLARPGDTASR